ncbi:MAG: hypothetical protein ACTHNS_09945 [Marmoricola sp.]
MVRTTLLSALAVPALSAALVATAVPAQAATRSTDPVPARQGAHWLVSQLTDGLIHNDQFGFDDLGLSADTALELGALGGRTAAVQRIAHAVAPQVKSYYSSTYDGVTTTYAGSLAKATVLAEVAGSDPASFGGHDLVSLLEQRVSTAQADAGRIHDADNGYGDANVLGQALAARGLAAAGSDKAASVVAFLLTQQCASGYFTLDMGSAATGTGCDARKAAPDTDATAYAVIQLAAIAHPTDAVTAAIGSARAWLRRTQKAGGAWGGGTSTTAANANSTGLAAWALHGSAAARRGALWIRRHQARQPAGCHNPLSSEQGAVAYDSATLAAGRHDGITTSTQDTWRRTTTQALVALTDLPAAGGRIGVTTRHRSVRPHQRILVQVTHAAPLSRVCLSLGGHRVDRAADRYGRARVRITVPQGRRHRVLAVVDSDHRHDAVRLTVRR